MTDSLKTSGELLSILDIINNGKSSYEIDMNDIIAVIVDYRSLQAELTKSQTNFSHLHESSVLTEAENIKLREALAFYANEDNWYMEEDEQGICMYVIKDDIGGGKRAIEALGATTCNLTDADNEWNKAALKVKE